MSEEHIGPYQRDIMDQIGCSAADAVMVEDIMERHVFHSTLDWPSDAEFRRGAQEAWQVLEEDREVFEGYFRQARQTFLEMRKANGGK